MGILDVNYNIEKQIANLKHSQFEKINLWLKHALPSRVWGSIIINPNETDVYSSSYSVDGIDFSYVDLYWDENIFSWVIKPRNVNYPIFMIIRTETPLDDDCCLPNFLKFHPDSKIFFIYRMDYQITPFGFRIKTDDRYIEVNPYNES